MPKQMSYTTSVEGGRVGGGWSDGEGEGWRGGAAEGWRQAESIVVFNTTGFKQHFYTTSVVPGAWPPSTCFKLSKLYRIGMFGFGFRARVRHGVVRVRSRHWLRNGCVDFPRRLCDVALVQSRFQAEWCYLPRATRDDLAGIGHTEKSEISGYPALRLLVRTRIKHVLPCTSSSGTN